MEGVKINKYPLIIVLFLVILPGIFAAIEVSNPDELAIEVNYQSLRDNDRNLELQESISFRSTDDPAVEYTFRASYIKTDYQLTLTQNTLSIGTADASLPFTLRVPTNVDEGISGTVARLTATAPDGTAQEFELTTDVQTMLEVKRIKVLVNGHEEERVDSNDENVEDIKPGDEIELRFQMENLFDDDYDYGDLEGTITIELDDSDFGDDVDEEEDFDIDAGEKFDSSAEEIIFTFTVPDDAEDGEYSLNMKVESEDENQAKYETNWDLNLEIEREDDDLEIRSFVLDPTEITCSGRVQLSILAANIGADRQRHAVLTLKSPKLGLDDRANYDLESGGGSDSKASKSIGIDIPEGTKPGTYPITAEIFYDYTIIEDRKVENLVVKKCVVEVSEEETEPEETEEEEEPSAPESPGANGSTEEASPPGASGQVVATVEDPYTIEDILIAAILVAIVMIFGLIIIFVVVLLKR